MPFLHWETDRKRHSFANFIDTVTAAHKAETEKLRQKSRDDEINRRKHLEKPARFAKKSPDQDHPSRDPWMGLLSLLKQNFGHQQRKDPPGSQQDEVKPTVIKLDSFVDALNVRGHRLDIDQHRRVVARIPNKDNQNKSQNRLGRYLSNALRLKPREPKDKTGLKDNQNRLGQYLIDAARLYEGITNYRDKKLLDKYLHVDPPIHPRRTLVSQAYLF